MKKPTFAFHISTGPAPFFSVIARPCTVIELNGETARVQMIGVKGQTIENWVQVADLASRAGKALSMIGQRLAIQHQKFLTAPAEKSAVPEMAGAGAV